MTGTLDQFLAELRVSEGSSSYSAHRPGSQYLGAYQLGSLALQDAGFQDANGNWTALANSYGVNSTQTFLSNPAAQNAAEINYLIKNEGYAAANGTDQYIGQTIGGVYITPSGLTAAEHLLGNQETLNWLQSNGTTVAQDANGTTIQTYLNRFSNYIIPGTSSYIDPTTGFLVEPPITPNSSATYLDLSTGNVVTPVTGSNGSIVYLNSNSSILTSNGGLGIAVDANSGLLVLPSAIAGGPVEFIDPNTGNVVVPITTTQGFTY